MAGFFYVLRPVDGQHRKPLSFIFISLAAENAS